MSGPAHNPSYNGRMVFLPKVGELRPGDIVLTRNVEGSQAKGIKASETIQALSGGLFSHALVCSVPPTFVEALPDGVSNLTLARCFAHDLKNVRVLRYPDAEIARKASVLAQVQVGRTYSKRKAAASIFPDAIIDEIQNRGIFCSALVAQAFSDAGAPQFAATKVNKTTPATLEKMADLIDITDQVFRQVLAPNNIEEMAALDGDRMASPSARQTALTMGFSRALIPLTDAVREQFPEAELELVNTFYEAIQFVVFAMDAREKVPLPRRAEFDAAVGALDDMSASLIDNGKLKAVADEMASIDTRQLQRELTASFDSKPDIDLAHMRAMAEAAVQQIARREAAIAELINWNSGRSKAMNAWIAFDQPVLDLIRTRQAVFNEILGRLQPQLGPVVSH